MTTCAYCLFFLHITTYFLTLPDDVDAPDSGGKGGDAAVLPSPAVWRRHARRSERSWRRGGGKRRQLREFGAAAPPGMLTMKVVVVLKEAAGGEAVGVPWETAGRAVLEAAPGTRAG